MTVDHWRAGTAAALVACTIGFATGEASFLVLAVIPLGFVAYDAVSEVAEPTVTVERGVSAERPRPGERVTVTLAVENVGDRPIGDLQLADEPPAGVPVTGETQLATALRPGERTTLEYDLELPRGEFGFGEVRARSRNLAGTSDRETTLPVDGVDELVCETPMESVPVRPETVHYVGETPTPVGGSGVEFFATREYQRGDPVGRINWRRYARTGDLSTVEFLEHRSATVVLVLDDRLDVQRSAPAAGPDTFDLSVYAAARTVPTLLEARHRVGLTTLTRLADREAVRIGSGPETRYRAEALLTAVEPASAGPSGQEADGDRRGQRAITQLVQSVPHGAQVVFCTPLTDAFPAELADELGAAGHGLTVLAPDLTGECEGVGASVERVERRLRATRLRRRGAAVIDWPPDEPVALAVARTVAARGWSK